MSSLSPSPLMRRAVLALAAAALTVLAFATTATAAPATGEVVLTLKTGAKSSLLREGVQVAPRSGKGKTQTVKLAVADLDLTTRTFHTGAALTLSASGKSVKLNDVQLKAGPKDSAISAKQGGKRKVFFRVAGSPLTIGSALSGNGALSLTGAGAKALRAALGLDGITAGKLGSGAFTAAVSPVDDGGPKPDQPKVDPYPYASQCPVGAVAGAPGGAGDAPGTVSGIAPAPVFNTGTSQGVTGTEVDWGFKQSFREYVLNVGGPSSAGSLQPLDGAGAVPTGTGMGDADSFFSFPAGGGTYERGVAADHSDDKLVVAGTGTVLFCKSAHGFNVVLKNPTVTIDGANSRITADLGANFNGTWYPFQRVDVADLDLGGVTPTITDGGTAIAWPEIPATLTEDGSKASGLGGFYTAGEALDPITLKTTLQRPVLPGCTIDAGTAAPAAVTFTPDVLPTLTSPVVRSGKNLGTINWGFRRSPRATTFTGGGANAFQLLGGANESFPGAMGGGNSLPPAGGLGKFFRFPISSYQYEAGTVDPADDRLIATSNATVGFCNINQGNFGLIISKPTLVIDGANSRIVANAYSFAGSFGGGPVGGWSGGRVKLVNLNMTGINAATGVGTVKWGEVNADFEPLQNGIPVAGGLQTEAFSKLGLTIASTAGGGMDPVAAQIVLPAP